MSNPRWTFALRGEGSETLEIDIYDVIGESWWREGVSAKSVRARLKEAKNASTIKLRVNSRGGDVIDGFAIYNLLNEHPARVEADVDALAASMASVILMAADEIRIASNGFVMIHNPWGLALGESDEMRATADLLDKMRDQIAAAYMARTGIGRDEVLAMMDAETWMTPNEAKEKGFVDKVKPAKKGASKAKALAGLDLSDLVHVPAGLLAAVAQARSEISVPGRIRAQTSGEDQGADEERTMAEDPTTPARLALLTRIEAILGATGEEAIGILKAWQGSHTELPTVKEQNAALEKSMQASTLEALIAKGKADNKLTPHLEKEVRDQFAAGDITLKGAEKWIENLSPIAALGGDKRQPAPPPQGGETPKWNGKTYAELTFQERADLKAENPELYEAMRKTFKPGAR